MTILNEPYGPGLATLSRQLVNGMSRKEGECRSVKALRTPFVLGLAAAATVVLSGCSILPSHIHDEKAAALSAKLQIDFAAYREDQSSLYENMTANLEAFKVEEEELLSRFAANYHEGLITAMPSITVGQYKRRLLTLEKDLGRLRAGLEKAVRDYVDETLQATGGATAAEQAIAKLKRQIKAKTAEAKSWSAMIAVYLDALSKLPTTIESLDSKEADLASLFASSETAGAALAPGKTVTSSEVQKIQSLIASVPRELKEAVLPRISEAPGISVRILELGLELAELEKRRADASIARLEVRKEILAQTYVQTRILDLIVKDAKDLFAPLNPDENRSQLIIDVAISERHESQTDALGLVSSVNKVHRRLQLLRNLGVAEWMTAYQKSLLTVRLARADHADSIAKSEENDLAWQAVIASGIDGLAEYHKGGLTKEDIANVMRLAQSIALIIIAA